MTEYIDPAYGDDALPLERGCGTRKEGGIYLEVGLSPFGRPIEDFLIDPPMTIPAGVDLPFQGILRADVEEGPLLLDHVGAEHYPNVADFVEEARRMGISRRVQGNLDLSGVHAGTRLYLAHQRAIIKAADLYQGVRRQIYQFDNQSLRGCPRRIPEHAQLDYRGMCAGLWWEDVSEGTDYADGGERMVLRQMPSFRYAGYKPPEGVVAGYERGLFMWAPLSRVVVVEAKDGSHKEALERVRGQVGGAIEVEEVPV